MYSPRRSDRLHRQHIYDCFGNHGPEELSPVQALGKLSATAMLTTARVGDPMEDPSMAQARPHLAEINERGIVTTDSQMGKKELITHRFDNGQPLVPPVTQWQRSYILGIMPVGLYEEFSKKMRLIDGVDFFIGVPGESPPEQFIHYINVTMLQQGPEDEPDFFTNVPMTTNTLEEPLLNLLPEVAHVMQSSACKEIVQNDALIVHVVDLIWGRPLWLFDKVKEVLQDIY